MVSSVASCKLNLESLLKLKRPGREFLLKCCQGYQNRTKVRNDDEDEDEDDDEDDDDDDDDIH